VGEFYTANAKNPWIGMKLTGFDRFDTSAGGLADTGSYLVCGEESAGKSSFCLGFAHRGLRAGEAVGLVTNQSPPRVLDKARQMGFHLNEYLAKKQLLIFEYPERVAEMAARVEDHSKIVDEFHGLLGNRKVERLVLDPVNPLVGTPYGGAGWEGRFDSIVTSFGRLRACILYVVESAHGPDEFAAATVHGVLTFRVAGQKRRRMRAELYTPARTSHAFAFEIREGTGLQEAAEPPRETAEPERPGKGPSRLKAQEAEAVEAEAVPDDFGGGMAGGAPMAGLANLRSQIDAFQPPEPVVRVQPARVQPMPARESGGPRILLVEADASNRVNLRAQLERNFVVIEASGVHDALTLVSMGRPDVILLAMEMPGVSGLELARTIREKGHNMLIVGMGDRTRHISERLGALAAGIDLCFAYSTDARLLRLTLLNLMQRLSLVPGRELSREAERIARRPEEDSHRCTQELSKFCGRIARETLYAKENGLPFVLLAFRLPEIAEAVERFAGLAASLTSVSDLVYAGPHGVACLLSETESPQRFLSQLWAQWDGGFSPTVEELRFANQDAFLHRAREFVSSRTGGRERKPMALAAAGGATVAVAGWKGTGGYR
jgi:CheY-like chemotaxis protein